MKKLLHALVIPFNFREQVGYTVEDTANENDADVRSVPCSPRISPSSVKFKVPKLQPRKSKPIKIVMPTPPEFNLSFTPSAFYEPPSNTATIEVTALLSEMRAPSLSPIRDDANDVKQDPKESKDGEAFERGTFTLLRFYLRRTKYVVQ